MRHPDELLREARLDVASKPRAQLHRESAWRWAALAVAAYEADRLSDVADYHHEALEHAGGPGEPGEVDQEPERPADRQRPSQLQAARAHVVARHGHRDRDQPERERADANRDQRTPKPDHPRSASSAT